MINYKASKLLKGNLTKPDLSTARLGVIGGSGLYQIPEMEIVEEIKLDTPFGMAKLMVWK